jgi:conjugal transfer/entry exclusion protein
VVVGGVWLVTYRDGSRRLVDGDLEAVSGGANIDSLQTAQNADILGLITEEMIAEWIADKPEEVKAQYAKIREEREAARAEEEDMHDKLVDAVSDTEAEVLA